jgi:aspartate aminotransferase-like enzyme
MEQQVVVDAVCSVASEEIQMDAWGIDVVLTASQKGLGTPPGLSIVVASQKAIQVCPFPYTYNAMQPLTPIPPGV